MTHEYIDNMMNEKPKPLKRLPERKARNPFSRRNTPTNWPMMYQNMEFNPIQNLV